MIRFALRNLAVKKVQVILVILSVVVSAGTGVLAYNTAAQVSDGITGTAAYYSAIIGPSGSKTQLAMNSMYFTDEPLGVIPYSLVEELLRDSRVVSAVPFAMADEYNGYSVVGTSPEYLSGKRLAEGEMFAASGECEAVLGYTAAKVCGAEVGDLIYTGHSAGQTHKTPLRIVGILERTHTVYDSQVFTQLRTIWVLHEAEEEEEEEEEDHDHLELDGMVCAVMVKTRNPAYATALVGEYDGKVVSYDKGSGEGASLYTLTAIEPMATVRGILREADNTRYIVFVLCGIILAMNVIVVSIVTLLNMYHSAAEIALMMLIGIGMGRINLLYLVQNAFAGLLSTVLAFCVSRLCLGLMGGYVASMGVVLDPSKVYPAELLILFCVFLISVLPTLVCTLVMSRRDSLGS
jgi:hypothetical protein